MINSGCVTCHICNNTENIEDSPLIFCDQCQSWFHGTCAGLCNDEINAFGESNSSWMCKSCELKVQPQNSQDASSELVICPLCSVNNAKSFKGLKGLKIHWTRAHPNEPLEHSDPINNSTNSFEAKLASCKINIKILRRIPKGARCCAADKLNQVIDRCLTQNTEKCWQDLMLFAYIAFRVPDKSNKGPEKSLVSKIKQNLRDFELTPFSHRIHKKLSRSRLVEAKVSDGDIRGAVRILSSDLGVARNTRATFETLLEKHPIPSRPLTFPDPPVSENPQLLLSEDLVLQAIKNFPNGSASGIDGIRPQHLKDLTSISAGDAGRRLLYNITRLCNLMLSGRVNDIYLVLH